MNKKEDWETFGSSLNCNTLISQAWERVRQVKDKDSKKLKSVNGAQYKYSKSKPNKIGDTLAELPFPQNYDPTFLELKQKEE